METSGAINGVAGLFEGVLTDLAATEQNGETIFTEVIVGTFTTVDGLTA